MEEYSADNLCEEVLQCPVCGTSFVKDETHKFIVRGGYTCSWSCFQKRVRGEG
jgi:hypothetical protein